MHVCWSLEPIHKKIATLAPKKWAIHSQNFSPQTKSEKKLVCNHLPNGKTCKNRIFLTAPPS